MPPYFVMGHGKRFDESKTFVPSGTRVRFYSEVDVNLSDTVALLAVADGARAPAVETVEGSGEETVHNYEVTEDSDGEAEELYAQWVAMGAKNAEFVNWMGKPARGQPLLAGGLSSSLHPQSSRSGRPRRSLRDRGGIGATRPVADDWQYGAGRNE
jgi:hypothetical protein